jgi:ferredoxin
MRLSHKWVPSVRRERCVGCGLCGAMCSHGSLEVVDGIGVLIHPEACTSEATCVSACPQGAIHMEWTPLRADHSAGRWRSASSPPRREAAAVAATGK